MNDDGGFEYRERLGRAAAGAILIDYLASRYAHSSRAEWEARIGAGLVRIDDAPVPADATLTAGRTLVWRRPPWDEPAAPLDFSVLHEDDDLVAVAKPAGLPTLPGANFLRHTLLHQVRLRVPNAMPVHRLGRWTSGVVLLARSRRTRAELARQLADREMGKRYRALASGEPASREWTVDVPIGPVPHPWLGTVYAASPSGRPSSSRVTVLERRAAGFLCDVRIATGRPHQIRIHLAAAGHPLVGDPLYAAGGVLHRDARAVPGDGGYLLHAAEVTLRHPATGDALTISCEPPPALRAT